MAQDDTQDQVRDDADQTTADEDRSTQKRPARKQPAKKQPARKQPARKQAAKKQATKTQSADGSTGRADAPRAEPPRRPSAGAIAREAAAQLHELTGHQIEGITGVRRVDEGWVVDVDLVELRRVPGTTDVLATYEVEVDQDGDLMGYRRRHRFVRGNVGEHR